MQVTTEHILWILAGLGVAGLAIFSLLSWTPRFMATEDSPPTTYTITMTETMSMSLL